MFILNICTTCHCTVSAGSTGSLDVLIALDDGDSVDPYGFEIGKQFMLDLISGLPKVHKCFLQVRLQIVD